MTTTWTTGDFALEFEPGGKLRQLRAAGVALLHESSYAFPLEHGRIFIPGGWDECYPTIEPFGASPTLGLLLAHAPTLTRDDGHILQTWDLPGFEATRRWSATGRRELRMTFGVVNRAREAAAFLWASHTLFTFQGLQSVALPDTRVLHDFSLDGTSAKFFAPAGVPVALTYANLRLLLRTDQPHWGIWFNRGGWPAAKPAGFGCIGIEATTTAADLPGDLRLAPGARFEGNVTLEIE